MEKLNILYEDNHIIVVEKQCGIMSQADISASADMLSILKSYIKEKYNKPSQVYLGLVHRLDTVTSGLMVFARTSKAASRLSEQIRQNSISKKYMAVFEETIKEASGEFTDYLLKNKSKNIVTVTDDTKLGKLSKLQYNVIKTKNGLSLVEINLLTGRTHQIRVQFSSRGYHIYGDAKYGAKNKDKKGIALHAYELKFIHPTTKKEMVFRLQPSRYPFSEFL